jgi:hypothetical protein
MSSDTGRTPTTPLLKVADADRRSTELTGTWPPRRIHRRLWRAAPGRSPLRTTVADRDSPTSINERRPLRAPSQDRSTGARSTLGERVLQRRASCVTPPTLATISLSLSLLLSCRRMRSEWIRVYWGRDGLLFWSSKVDARPSDPDGRSAWFWAVIRPRWARRMKAHPFTALGFVQKNSWAKTPFRAEL